MNEGISIRRAADHRVVPWRNGGGLTSEVAVRADPSGTDFLWRISIANVNKSGPFSSFDGIDRSIAVISGQGIRLREAGGPPRLLTRMDEPYRFQGETDIWCDVVEGETSDLNVMTRRAAMDHSLRRIELSGATEIDCKAAETAIMANGLVGLAGAGLADTLGPLDALLGLDAGTRIRLTPHPKAEIFLIEFEPVES